MYNTRYTCISQFCISQDVEHMYLYGWAYITAYIQALLNLSQDGWNMNKKRSMAHKSTSKKSWFVSKIFRMHTRYGNRWIEYRDPIDLIVHLSNMKVSLCW